ncbi:MAG: hypothetical protein ACI9WC_000444 [Arenicella sp.]|jgi:hypothetical protein
MNLNKSKMRLLLFLFLFAPSGSYACSCSDLPTLEENSNNYDRILLVKLKGYRNIFFQKKYTVNIKEVLKGQVKPTLQSLVVGNTSCDPQLIDNGQWLVFLKPETKKLQLGWCGPHQTLENLENGTPHWREIIKASK